MMTGLPVLLQGAPPGPGDAQAARRPRLHPARPAPGNSLSTGPNPLYHRDDYVDRPRAMRV